MQQVERTKEGLVAVIAIDKHPFKGVTGATPTPTQSTYGKNHPNHHARGDTPDEEFFRPWDALLQERLALNYPTASARASQLTLYQPPPSGSSMHEQAEAYALTRALTVPVTLTLPEEDNPGVTQSELEARIPA